MKIRTCDKCRMKIEDKTSYYKVCFSKYKESKKILGSGHEIVNKIQSLNHVGDLCLTCWEQLTK